jgi:iron complex outermembrane receptor protein
VTQAITAESALPGDGSVGKQLPYTPRFLGNASLGIHYRQVFLSYQHNYTGSRFITSDETYGLPGFHFGSITGLLQTNVAAHPVAVSLRVANLWNEDYTVVSGRPMPLRHFLLTVRLGII